MGKSQKTGYFSDSLAEKIVKEAGHGLLLGGEASLTPEEKKEEISCMVRKGGERESGRDRN